MKLLIEQDLALVLNERENPLVRAIAMADIKSDVIHPTRGVMVVIAGTKGGKSKQVGELNELLSARDDVVLAHFAYGEPTVDRYSNQLSAPPLLAESQLVDAVTAALAQNATHIIIDSIRLMQYETEGPATSGGMSTGTFALLTKLSAIAYAKGITLILPLNPNAKDDLYPLIKKNIEGSVHTVLDLEENEVVARELDRESIKASSAQDVINAFYSDKQLKKTSMDFELTRQFAVTTSRVDTIASTLVAAISPEDASHKTTHEPAPGLNLKSIKDTF